jgi:hypothetical protein
VQQRHGAVEFGTRLRFARGLEMNGPQPLRLSAPVVVLILSESRSSESQHNDGCRYRLSSFHDTFPFPLDRSRANRRHGLRSDNKHESSSG